MDAFALVLRPLRLISWETVSDGRAPRPSQKANFSASILIADGFLVGS